MTDYFALLDEPRRPWLEADALKRKFLSLSAALHPDRVHRAGEAEKNDASRRYAELNAAYQCLREPKTRLRHLLELELGARPKDLQPIPAALADLFAEVAATCRETDGCLAEKARTTSPLLQVQIFQQGQQGIERLKELQNQLNGLRGKRMDELKSLDQRWAAADAGARKEMLPALEELSRWLGYFNRWLSQIQERMVQLSW
ncbi:MAG: hypothetical protein ABSE16_07410 [Verrucomicrobiota bacterium]|jgi:curved DNA-binding protein CbpA